MKYYLAPLEGITTHIFRRTYHKYFYPMDKYFTPFLSPHTKREFNTREQKDILPENNPDMYVVPQILSNDAEGFIRTAKKLKDFGYREINLNLGCPSKTVVGKGRGSGFLSYPEELEAFLDEIFTGLDMKISVKTRIGRENPQEFLRLLQIFNKFPMEELIIHPRVQKDFYQNHPNMEMFAYAVQKSDNTLCYNGDLFTISGIAKFHAVFPETERIMLGRGILRNPGLLQLVKEGKGPEKQTLLDFHEELVAQYAQEMSGDRNVLFKMKEIWSYWIYSFADSEKYAKKIRKCMDLKHYINTVEELFQHCSYICPGQESEDIV